MCFLCVFIQFAEVPLTFFFCFAVCEICGPFVFRSRIWCSTSTWSCRTQWRWRSTKKIQRCWLIWCTGRHNNKSSQTYSQPLWPAVSLYHQPSWVYKAKLKYLTLLFLLLIELPRDTRHRQTCGWHGCRTWPGNTQRGAIMQNRRSALYIQLPWWQNISACWRTASTFPWAASPSR